MARHPTYRLVITRNSAVFCFDVPYDRSPDRHTEKKTLHLHLLLPCHALWYCVSGQSLQSPSVKVIFCQSNRLVRGVIVIKSTSEPKREMKSMEVSLYRNEEF
ncbi:hypothetical protein CEXT_300491 [Caerostris extrusa]|uniref:Uncharacterized protein n=1 Tax=Caerostris extrusa TaxID=172846 RepID=A0AAV4PIW0_CAEEX|nr:hypothetical protein CEXT_300491 [Caerostris extrusa]